MELALSVERAIAARRAMDHIIDSVDGAQKKGALDAAIGRLPEALASAVTALDMARVQRALPKPLLLAQGTVLLPLTRVGEVAVVEVLSEPLAADHMDDWLLQEGFISLRMLERQLIDLWIAELRDPEICPVDIRLQDRLALGTAIDAAYASAAGTLAPAEALQPLCRRERQRRLAHVAMAPKHTFPFAPGVLLDDVERALLDRLQKVNGLGGKARALMYSMLQADEDLRAAKDRLVPAAEALLGTLAIDAALRTQGLATAWACSPDRQRFLASLFARFASDQWPSSPERDDLVTFLYGLSGESVPTDGAMSGPRILALWTRLSGLPARSDCTAPATISDAARAILADAALDGERDLQ